VQQNERRRSIGGEEAEWAEAETEQIRILDPARAATIAVAEMQVAKLECTPPARSEESISRNEESPRNFLQDFSSAHRESLVKKKTVDTPNSGYSLYCSPRDEFRISSMSPSNVNPPSPEAKSLSDAIAAADRVQINESQNIESQNDATDRVPKEYQFRSEFRSQASNKPISAAERIKSLERELNKAPPLLMTFQGCGAQPLSAAERIMAARRRS